MKFLVMTKARAAVVPPQDPIAAVKEAVAWIEGRLADGTTDCAYGIVPSMSANVMNADSHEDLWRILTDYPLFDLWDWEVYPLCDIKQFADQRLKILQRMARK